MTELDVRPQRARRRLGGTRVLARKLRVEPCPTFRRRGLCDECQPRCGATLFEPRPVGTAPECVPPWRHALDEDSPAHGTVSRAGDDCGMVVACTKRRWHDHRPASQTGQGGACSRSARNRRRLPLPRPEQLRVEGSPLSRGRRDHCADSKTRAGPFSTDGRAAPLPRRPLPRRPAAR